MHVDEIASNLRRLGHDVHVVVRRRGRNERPVESTNGYTIHRVYRWIVLPGPASLSLGSSGSSRSVFSNFYYLYLRSIFAFYVSMIASSVISKNRLDSIIERETAFGAGGLASVFTGRPLILEVVGPRYSRLSVRRSTRVLYYTRTMIRDWVDVTKCQRVAAGVNTELFHPDPGSRESARRSLGYADSDTVVGYVGSFQPWHGVDVFIEAMALLGDGNRKLRGLLVGPNFEKYKKMAETSGVGSSLSFTGAVPYETTGSFINACDMMVAPYNPAQDDLRRRYGIGWPIKVLEYMACGKAVIATGVSPVDEMVKDKVTGIMVAPGDPAMLADAISLLTDERALREEVASKALSEVVPRYTWKTVTEQLSRVVTEA